MALVIRLLKPILFALFRIFAPVLRALDVDAKGWYEFAFWKYGQMRQGTLKNHYYEAYYTELFGLERDHYNGVKLLDIGCGPSGSLEWADMTSERVGLDPLVDRYQHLGIDQHKMRYVHAPAEAIPFEDGYFDIVTSINSLDHVDDLAQTLAEITRVVRVGGEFMVMTHIHQEPTIAEPIEVPWDLTQQLADQFEVIKENHFELAPDSRTVVDAIHAGIPFDHTNTQKRYGVLQARLRRK